MNAKIHIAVEVGKKKIILYLVEDVGVRSYTERNQPAEQHTTHADKFDAGTIEKKKDVLASGYGYYPCNSVVTHGFGICIFFSGNIVC